MCFMTGQTLQVLLLAHHAQVSNGMDVPALSGRMGCGGLETKAGGLIQQKKA